MNELIEKLPEINMYEVVVVPIQHLNTAEYNPRTIDDAALESLKKSLSTNTEFLKARPPIVNAAKGREGIVIGGNMRVRAARELGWDRIPVMFVDAKTIEQEKVWNILDNKNAGSWDGEKLKTIVTELHGIGYDLTTIGHTPTEIGNIMSGDFNMGDPKKDDAYKEKGTTPGKRWVKCPECAHEFRISKKVKIDDPTATED